MNEIDKAKKHLVEVEAAIKFIDNHPDHNLPKWKLNMTKLIKQRNSLQNTISQLKLDFKDTQREIRMNKK